MEKLLETLKGLIEINKSLSDELCQLISIFQDSSKTVHTSVEAPYEFTDTPGTYIPITKPTPLEITRKLDSLSLGKVNDANPEQNGN